MEEGLPHSAEGGGEGVDGVVGGAGGGFLDAGDVTYTRYRPAKVRVRAFWWAVCFVRWRWCCCDRRYL